MTAYDAASGVELLATKLPLQYFFSSAPTAANGIVYVGGAGSGGTVYAVDELTGSVLATQPVENGDEGSPARSKSGVFVSYACNQAYGFARVTLAPRWHFSTCCKGGGGKTTVFDNGRIFTRDFFGNLILDSTSGGVLGSYGPASLFEAVLVPAVKGNTMWLLNAETGTLSAQNLSTPSSPLSMWTFDGDGQLVTAPIVLSTPQGDFVIEGSASGMLYALNAVTGLVVGALRTGCVLCVHATYSSKRLAASRLRSYRLVSGNGGNQDSRRTIQLS